MTTFPPFQVEGTKLLVVEDEIIIGEHLCMTLNGLGYRQIRLAANGLAAVEAARKDPPDLLFMDISLPGQMDGIQAACAILEIHPAPIIFITGNTDPALRHRAQDLDPYGYIPKPFNRQILEDQILLAMVRWKTEQRLKRLARCYEKILDEAEHSVVVIDLDDETILGANATACRLLGLERFDPRTRSIHTVPHLDAILAEAALTGGETCERHLFNYLGLNIHVRLTKLEGTNLVVMALDKKSLTG